MTSQTRNLAIVAGCGGVALLALTIWAGTRRPAPPSPAQASAAAARTAADRSAVELREMTFRLRLRETDENAALISTVSYMSNTAYVQVTEGWYRMPCHQRLDVAAGCGKLWRDLGGLRVVIRDYAGREVGSSSGVYGSKVKGCS